MLRVSAKTTKRALDLALVNGEFSGDSDIAFGQELTDFASAFAGRDEDELKQARQTLLAAAGQRALVDAAGVAANFQRMVRIADSMGIPVDGSSEMMDEVRDTLDLYRFKSAENSAKVLGRKTLNRETLNSEAADAADNKEATDRETA